jgi:glycogen debranching enzyme
VTDQPRHRSPTLVAGRTPETSAGLPAPARSGADIDPLARLLAIAYRGPTVLCTRSDGEVDVDDPELAGTGLFHAETRIMSRHRLRLNGERGRGSGTVADDGASWTGHLLVPRAGGAAAGPGLPQDTVGIRIERVVDHGLVERVTITNHAMTTLESNLELELAADFADVMEIRRARRQFGRTDARWAASAGVLTIRYEAEHEGRRAKRGLRVAINGADTVPVHASLDDDGHRLTFAIRLPSQGTWSAELAYSSLADGSLSIAPPLSDRSTASASSADATGGRRPRPADRPQVIAPDGLIGPAFAQAGRDLVALRDDDLEGLADQRHGRAWVTGAGFPHFTGFFGRDSLTAAYQAAMLGPEFLRGAIDIVARTQGRRDDPWTEEQPGRMVHEMRRGPLAELRVTPHGRYYGTQTTASMFLVALSELWHWTGDLTALARYREPAVRAIEWAERVGDLDGDGFLEYEKRSTEGLKNQGWKDSDEAIRYVDGRIVPNPIATVEEQAFHYLALQRMAEIHVALGDDRAADACLARADQLRRRFADAFTMADGFLALALDPDKRQVASIASNAGHALAAGILPPERAAIVADRLLAPDLLTAWGVRTLSERHPSYNPFAYHLGAVWPVENASFALGCKRYGLDDHAGRLTDALLRAAGHHHRLRLPEAIAGIDIDESPVPAPYPSANRPQAWSASALVQAIQIMLGLYPFAPGRVLGLVRPRLPDWIPRLRLEGLRVGDAVIDLDFERAPDGTTDWHVSRTEGSLHVVAAGPPTVVDDDESLGERVSGWAIEHLPGRTARALRIALGREGPADDGDDTDGRPPANRRPQTEGGPP